MKRKRYKTIDLNTGKTGMQNSLKSSIIKNCPKIQIGEMKKNSSSEHLIIVKT